MYDLTQKLRIVFSNDPLCASSSAHKAIDSIFELIHSEALERDEIYSLINLVPAPGLLYTANTGHNLASYLAQQPINQDIYLSADQLYSVFKKVDLNVIAHRNKRPLSMDVLAFNAINKLSKTQILDLLQPCDLRSTDNEENELTTYIAIFNRSSKIGMNLEEFEILLKSKNIDEQECKVSCALFYCLNPKKTSKSIREINDLYVLKHVEQEIRNRIDAIHGGDSMDTTEIDILFEQAAILQHTHTNHKARVMTL